MDCRPLRLKDKHFIAMSLKDKTPSENGKIVKLAKGLKCSQYQKYCCKFFASFSLCLMIFSLCHARHVFGSCYTHFVLVTVSRGTQNTLLDMLCEVMSVRRSRLQEKHVLEY